MNEDQEINAKWKVDEDVFQVEVELDDARVVLESRSDQGGFNLSILISNLETIVHRVLQEIDQDGGADE